MCACVVIFNALLSYSASASGRQFFGLMFSPTTIVCWQETILVFGEIPEGFRCKNPILAF